MTPAERDMMDAFQQDYLSLLDDRVAKIRQLLGADEAEPARVALLSLESSSAMVGAKRLADVAKRLRSVLGEGDDALPPLLAELEAESAGARDEMARRTD